MENSKIHSLYFGPCRSKFQTCFVFANIKGLVIALVIDFNTSHCNSLRDKRSKIKNVIKKVLKTLVWAFPRTRVPSRDHIASFAFPSLPFEAFLSTQIRLAVAFTLVYSISDQEL